MKKIRLTKLKDDFFNGSHPNNIHEGFIQEGYLIEDVKIGDSFTVYRSKLFPVFSTSLVTQLPDKNNVFKTCYSTYRIEILDDLKDEDLAYK